MKISLQSIRDIIVLSVKHDVSTHDLAVLIAGIKNQLVNAHNRIVLDVSEAHALPTELVHALGDLHQLASELGGGLILSGLNKGGVLRFKGIASQKGIHLSANTEQALHHFRTKRTQVEEGSDSPSNDLIETLEAKEAEIDRLREELEKTEGPKTNQLRDENQELKKQVQSLLNIVDQWAWERSIPTDLQSAHQKIKRLEDQIAKWIG